MTGVGRQGAGASLAGGSLAGGSVAGVLGLLVLTECGVPLPVPADLLMLLVGQQAAAGTLPLPVAAAALLVVAAVGTSAGFVLARGPGRAVLARLGPRLGLGPERIDRATDLVVRRGRGMLTLGRATPGLRTLTLVAAASAVPAGVALPLLVLGSAIFLEAHLVLGYLLGAAATRLVAAAAPVLVGVVVLLALAALARALLRRRAESRRASDDAAADSRWSRAAAWSEAACPACLAITAALPAADRRPLRRGSAGPPARGAAAGARRPPAVARAARRRGAR
jgi:membrane protein DedA with SNARE-associated domain